MHRQYGKPSTALIMQKQSFFKDNKKHIDKQRNISRIYVAQPIRKCCKNCGTKLNSEADFIKDGIPYKICTCCTHLNGAHEDTNEFCDAIYSLDDGKSYAENYNSESLEHFNYRVLSIYLPKAEFLFTSLKNNKENPNSLKYLDFGAGAGYFVSALSKAGLKNVTGTEVSKSQVELGNQMIGDNLLSLHSIADSEKVLSGATANVISMIGVLEHLQCPRKAIEAIARNVHTEYVYISVPLFSLSVYLELLSDSIFHRQLHGGHTHLYTDESIKYLADEFGFEIVSQWWFGTDVVDLYRNIYINLENKEVSERVRRHYTNMMKTMVDAMQLEIDKKHFSSEVHVLLKK